MHLSHFSRCLIIGLYVINTCLDIQIYAQMENIKLARKPSLWTRAFNGTRLSFLYGIWMSDFSSGGWGNSCPQSPDFYQLLTLTLSCWFLVVLREISRGWVGSGLGVGNSYSLFDCGCGLWDRLVRWKKLDTLLQLLSWASYFVLTVLIPMYSVAKSLSFTAARWSW